jgi:hypothetical protein
MARRDRHPGLDVRASFEAARIAPQCLAGAYERLVPVPRRPTRPAVSFAARPGPVAAAVRPGRRRAEGG